jgi:hypothetical protein
MVDLGMNPLEALKSATGNAAQLLGISQKLGTLEKGKLGRCGCRAGRSDCGHHRNRACFIRDERRQSHSAGPARNAKYRKYCFAGSRSSS